MWYWSRMLWGNSVSYVARGLPRSERFVARPSFVALHCFRPEMVWWGIMPET